ncbi:WD repeat-containing protein pop1 [Bienertia sinuspersici]
MRKENKEQAMETLNPYERSRIQRVQECKARLLNSGIVDIKKSLTSLVDSQKNEKRKKNLKVADNGDADYGPNLDSSGDEDEEEEEDRVTTPTRNKVIKKMAVEFGVKLVWPRAVVTRGMLQSMKYVPPATLKRYVNLTKHQRQGGGKSEKRKAPTVDELILKNKQLPREALMENTIALDGETELDERANANRGMDELMAESENESDEESAAEEHERESDIDADVLDGLSESDEDENNTNDLDDRAIKELQIQAIILNEFGQPIGPVTPEKDTVGEFSRFLGTIARDYGTAPLLHKTWKLVPSKEKMWEYVLTKYIVPEQGREWVLKTVGAAWRIHKCRFKKKRYYRYPNNKLRWLNRPKRVPDDDFKKLLILWNKKTEKKAMKNYTPPDDGSGPKDPYLGVMGKEYTGRRRLYGRGVTNKVLHKVASSSVNYVVPDEHKKAELEANYAKKMEEFDKTKDKMVQDVLEKLISKLPTNVV